MLVSCDPFGDDPIYSLAWQEEKRIHEHEQSEWTAGLSIKVHPLLNSVECFYCFPAGDIEVYTLEHIQSDEGNYLQLWRNENGWQYAVNVDCVPFSYHPLIELLQDIPDTEPFIRILEAPVLAQFASLALSLDRIIRITRYLYLDYPCIYLLIVAYSDECKFSGRVITRENLAACFGSPALTNGQMSALRKLNLESSTLTTIKYAIHILIYDWQSIKRFVVHEKSIQPHALLFLQQVARHDHQIQFCRWVNHDMANRWFGNTRNATQHRREVDSLVSQFLIEWYSLVRFGIKPQHLNSDMELVRVFARETEKLLGEDCITATQINVFKCRVFANIDPTLHEFCECLFDEMRSDILYNDENSVFLVDSTVFMLPKGKACAGFTHISTAGDLRTISGDLQNCAAYRVKEGIAGRSEFWRYDDIATGEVALLQITTEKYPSAGCIVEFNGFANQGVSPGAKESLQQWLRECQAGFAA